MTPDQMQSFMLKLAEASSGDRSASNQVFVYRQVLTDVYRIGHDDGMRDSRRDEWVRDTIEREFGDSEETPDA